MENRMLMRWETPELKHLLLLGKENKSGTFYMPEDKHSCFIYTFQGISQRSNTTRTYKWFSTTHRGRTQYSYTAG